MNKTNLKAIAQSIRALAKSIETLELTPCLVFDEASLRVTLAPMAETLGEDAIEKMIGTARKAHEAKHGNGQAQNESLVFSTFQTGFMDIIKEHGIKSVRRSNSVTSSDITKAQCEQALKRRATGVPLSALAEEFGTDYTNLRLAIIREVSEDALATANEAAKAKKSAE